MQTKLLGRHQNILHSFSLRERRGSNISRFVSLSNVFLSMITWFNSHIKKSKCIWWISESSICIFHLKQTDSKRLKIALYVLRMKDIASMSKTRPWKSHYHLEFLTIFDELWSSTYLSTFILFHYYIKPEHKFDLRSYETF